MADRVRANWSDLASRVVSGVLMAVVALAGAWFGGAAFFLFWLLAALAILAEWLAMTTGSWRVSVPLVAGAAAICCAALLACWGHTGFSFLAVLAGAILVAALPKSGPDAAWTAGAVPYAATAVVPIVLLRGDEVAGATAVFFVFAVVWGSDIMAYFTGRTLGGPKLWPRVSPKKTWSGFLGGLFFGALAGTGVAFVAGLGHLSVLFVIGGGLAVVSQGGDLLESSLKRRFGVKDASRLIPGHGGVMDRLDGFLAASLAALVIGLCRDAVQPATGLLHW